MKERWLDDLKKKMEGHKETSPEHLWNAIDQELFSKKEAKIIPLLSELNGKSKKEKRFQKRQKRKQIIRVAASVVVLITAGFTFYTNNKQITIIHSTITDSQIQPEKKLPETGEYELINPTSESALTKTIPEKKNVIINKSKIGSTHYSQYPDEHPTFDYVYGKREVIEPLPDEKSDNPSQDTSDQQIAGHETMMIQNGNNGTEDLVITTFSDEKQSLMTEDSVLRTPQKKWSLGLLSGQFSSNSTQQVSGYAMMNGDPMDATVDSEGNYTEDPLNNIIVGNQEKQVETKIRHKTPVRMGVSLYYPLGNRWAVNTGITYTKLSSELVSGSAAYRYNSRQQLHYIGVPLQLNYTIWSAGRLTTYANMGVHVEKVVYGTLKTDYIVDSVLQESTLEKIRSKTIQTSLNAGLGVNYSITDHVGIYFEPGIRYHFDDKSTVYTIYKDKPLNFNVQFGLRLNIRK